MELSTRHIIRTDSAEYSRRDTEEKPASGIQLIPEGKSKDHCTPHKLLPA